MTNRRLLGALTLAVVGLVCVACLELALTLLAPVPDPYAYLLQLNPYIRSSYPPNYRRLVTTEEGLPGVTGKKTISTNNVAMRGPHLAMPKPADEYRIVLVGGSTTECGILDDSEALHSILATQLNEKAGLNRTIRVYNSGVSGHKSDDHLSWLAHRIVHLSPDMVITFAGVNDLFAAIADFDYLHVSLPPHSRMLLARMVSTRFQIPRRLFYLANRIANPTDQEVMEKVGALTNFAEKIEVRKSSFQSDEPPRTDLVPYETNLATMAGMAAAHHFQLVFMTQQSTWASNVDPAAGRWQWARCQQGTTYREDYMDAALKKYNASTRRVAARLNVPVYDLELDCPKSIEYFYDDIHFNEKGAAEAGRLLAEFLVAQGLLPKDHAAESKRPGSSD